MARILPVAVDSRIHVPGGLHRDIRNAIKRAFKHNNPDFFKKKNMGFRTFGIERQIKTFSEGDKAAGYPLELPRGGFRLLRELLDAEGIKIRVVDRTTKVPADFPVFCVDPEHPEHVLRPYQREALDACIARGNGIVRAPTGSGKTTIALAAIAALGQRAIVLLRDGQLAKQWIREIERCLDIPKKEIGEIRGGKQYAPGRRITVALQQSLYRKGNRLDELLRDEPFGTVVVDEVQGAAARTFLEVIDHFPARYRLGFSADETRKDGKEFLTYDVFGNVIYEIERDELEKKGHVLPVSIRMIPTEFRADWYRDAPPAEKDWTRLIEEIINDDERNELVIRTITGAIYAGEKPAFVWTGRVEHAVHIADERLFELRRPCGLMLGGVASRAERFDEARIKLGEGILDVAVGTFKAIGVGINLPAIAAGIVATPIGNNPQYFNQVRGRLVRPAAGKSKAVMYYVWDRYVWPDHAKKLKKWNGGDVEILGRDGLWHAA